MTTDQDRADYEAWYKKADAACIATAGVGIDDLPDGPSWDAWADGTPAADYATDQLDAEGFPG